MGTNGHALAIVVLAAVLPYGAAAQARERTLEEILDSNERTPAEEERLREEGQRLWAAERAARPSQRRRSPRRRPASGATVAVGTGPTRTTCTATGGRVTCARGPSDVEVNRVF